MNLKSVFLVLLVATSVYGNWLSNPLGTAIGAFNLIKAQFVKKEEPICSISKCITGSCRDEDCFDHFLRCTTTAGCVKHWGTFWETEFGIHDHVMRCEKVGCRLRPRKLVEEMKDESGK